MKTISSNSYVIAGMLLLVVFIVSCSKKTSYTGSDIQIEQESVLTQSGITVTVYKTDGKPDPNANKTHSLSVIDIGTSRQVEVSLLSPVSVHSSYLEVRFDGTREYPTDIQAGSALQKHQPLAYMGSPEAGTVICAQVIPGEKNFEVSGSLLTLKLQKGVDQTRKASAFTQNQLTEPIIADFKIDTGNPSKVYWSFKLRGDGNLNLKFDFADFGVVGAKYGKSVVSNPSSEPVDADGKGNVDFADFGIVGANYNKSITKLFVYRDDNTTPTTLVGSLDFAEKGEGTLTLDPSAKSVGSDGFNNYWLIVPGSGSNIRLELPSDENRLFIYFSPEVEEGFGTVDAPWSIKSCSNYTFTAFDQKGTDVTSSTNFIIQNFDGSAAADPSYFVNNVLYTRDFGFGSFRVLGLYTPSQQTNSVQSDPNLKGSGRYFVVIN